MKKDQVYEATAIGDVRIVPTLKFFRDIAKDYCGELSNWEHITIVTNDGTCNGLPCPVYNTFESGDDMVEVRKVLRKTGVLAVIWETGFGETGFYGDPDSLIYATPESEKTFTLSELLAMPESDPRFADPYFFSEYSNM